MNKSTELSNPASIEELIVNIKKMMDEVEAIADNSTKDNGEADNRLSDWKNRLSRVTSRLGDACQTVRSRVVTGTRKADETIREHPYESLAVAVGFGILVGTLLRRRN
jgi:ElaB/YqjD/DUF883 family membrane-anchored ribosome-binding protein